MIVYLCYTIVYIFYTIVYTIVYRSLNNRLDTLYCTIVYIFLHNHFDNTFSCYIQIDEDKDGEKLEEVEDEQEDNRTLDEND